MSVSSDELRELEEREEKMKEEIREKFEKKEDLRRLVETEQRELAEAEKVGEASDSTTLSPRLRHSETEA